MCLAVSALIHVLVLIQPWNYLLLSKAGESPLAKIPVKLIDERCLPAELFAQDQEPRKEQEEGISFEAEGNVSADYMDLLKARIFKAWNYPEEAIVNGREGTVKVAFVLDRAGKVIDVGVVKSSGDENLDTAAMDAVRDASPFGPFTSDVNDTTLKITGNFCYVLD